MKALSIRQPWAWLIVHGHKDIENRGWPAKYRGQLLIHASKTFDHDGYEFAQAVMEIPLPAKAEFPMGAIVGKADMVDCVDDSDSEWFFGEYGFVLENPTAYPVPFPYKGQLGFFEVDPKELTHIEGQ